MDHHLQDVDTGWATPPAEACEVDLLRRVGARDRDAFTELYVLYHRRLARFLTRLTRRYDVAEEIINDTMLVVWQRAAEFRNASRVSTWIMGIAYRRALNTLRRASMQTRADVADDRNDHATAADAADAVSAIQEQRFLQQGLALLPLEQRLVLEFTYYLGHSCEEIATIMDCPVNTVKTRMFHARRKLRDLLPQFGYRHAGEDS